MTRIHADITEIIGRTPLVELARYREAKGLGARIVGKVEAVNPAGSVKDRIALGIVRDAEERGALAPGATIVDITSGNTGIALAAIAAARGYRAKFYLGDNISPDKIALIEALGAEVVKIPNEFFLDPEALEKAAERIRRENPDAFYADQLGNPANPRTHYGTTGPEIWADSDGGVDVLVGAVGTGGTLAGAGAFLKHQKPEVRIVVAQPGEASLPSEEHPRPKEIDGVHKVTEVEPQQLPGNYDATIVDEWIDVETADAWRTAREVARYEGLIVGSSSGAILRAATTVAARPEHAGKLIVAVLPDSGERYLTAGIFADSLE